MCFVKYVMIVDKDVRVVVGWRRGVMVDGDDCRWLCVLKELLGVHLAWYGLWWVWLERCRDSSYAVNALRCVVWVAGACIVVCIFTVFWGNILFFGGSAS